MKNFLAAAVVAFLFCSMINAASATLINPATTTGYGTYYGSLSLLSDGDIPAEGAPYHSIKNVHWNANATYFIFDFNGIYNFEDILVSVDNNDWYNIDYSLNGIQWINALKIGKFDGEITSGMDTMTTVYGDIEYLSTIDFLTPFQAQYLKVYAAGGDYAYAVGELQAYGTSAALVPEPSTALLLGFWFTFIVVTRKKLIDYFNNLRSIA